MTTVLVCLLMGGLLAGQAVVGQVGGLPQAPPRDARAERPVGTASIQGRVTAADTGSPLRRALVNLMGSTTRGVYTDDEGRYVFTRLPAGVYTILVNPGTHRGGYQPTFHGGPKPSASSNGHAQPIPLADGQTLENIDVALPRTSVIAGRVTDAAGEPAARVMVQALMIRAGDTPVSAGSASTNDLGEFRIFHLAPGEYMVMANASNVSAGSPVEGEPVGFAPSYLPGVPTTADAMRIRLGRGTQVTADIRLIETRVYTVSGTVMSASGDPAAGGSLSIVARDSPGGTMFSTGVNGHGTFSFRNIPPGSYELSCRYHGLPRAPGATAQPAPASLEFGSIAIDVAGDMEHVVIGMTTGAVITGEFAFDEPFPASGRVNISPTPVETRPLSGIPSSEAGTSAFTLRGVFGPLLLRGNASGGPTPWALKAVLLRGKDITDEPTIFKASDSGHLQMVFTSRAPTLEGSVVGDDGQRALGARIVIFGHDPKTWTPRSSFYRTATVSGDGTFTMRGLREGRYYAVAIPADVMTNVGQPTPEFLETLSAVATVFTLNTGETRTLDLRLLKFEKP